MEHFAETPSRWKDYYDLWLISDQLEFGEQSLQKALRTTFAKRKTKLPTDRPSSLSIALAQTNQKNWESFLHKNGLENDEIKDLSSVVDKIWLFLQFPLHNMDAAEAEPTARHWTPGKRKWL